MLKSLRMLGIVGFLGSISTAQADRAQDFLNRGDYVRAYHAAIQDNNFAIASQAAWAYSTFKDPHNAIWINRGLKVARLAVEKYPRNADLYVYLSSMLGNRAELRGISVNGFKLAKESKRVLEKGVAINPNSPHMLVSLARWHSGAYIRGGRLVGGSPEKARSLAIKALNLSGEDITVLLDIAIMLAELKDVRATRFLKRALVIPPKNALERDWQISAQEIMKNLIK